MQAANKSPYGTASAGVSSMQFAIASPREAGLNANGRDAQPVVPNTNPDTNANANASRNATRTEGPSRAARRIEADERFGRWMRDACVRKGTERFTRAP